MSGLMPPSWLTAETVMVLWLSRRRRRRRTVLNFYDDFYCYNGNLMVIPNSHFVCSSWIGLYQCYTLTEEGFACFCSSLSLAATSSFTSRRHRATWNTDLHLPHRRESPPLGASQISLDDGDDDDYYYYNSYYYGRLEKQIETSVSSFGSSFRWW